MGSNQSSQLKQTTEILNKSVTNVVNTNVTKARADNNNVNNFDLLVGEKADIKNCSLRIGQKINSSQKLKVMANVQSLSDLKTMLQTAVDNTTKQSNDATSGFLSTAFNNQKSDTEITNILHNEIENNVTSENLTECNAIIDNINKGVFELRGKWDCGTQGPIQIDQDIASAQVVECFSDALQQALMKNENIAAAVNKSEQENKSKIGGIAEAISAVLGPYSMIIIAVIIGIVLILGIGAYFILSGGGEKVAESYNKMRSYSPLKSHYNINSKYIFIAILLAIIYFSKKKENYANEKTYEF